MRLLPRDEKFFELLTEQGKIVLDASSLMAKAMKTDGLPSDFHETAQKIRELERKGDSLLRNIYHKLHKTFITPIDAEDVHALASRIDEILDHLEAAAYRFEAYGLQRTPEGIPEIAQMVNGCVAMTVEALETLQRDGPENSQGLQAKCEQINKLELDTEERVRQAIRELFANERDAIALMKQKEIYELLESAADCCEDVADTLEAVAVKNS